MIEGMTRKVIAKGVNKLPDVPMLIEYLLMIFGNNVVMVPDEENPGRIGALMHGSNKKTFDYHFSQAEIGPINNLRKIVKNYLEKEEYFLHKDLFWQLFNHLIVRGKYYYIKPSRWKKQFLSQSGDLTNEPISKA
jgi:hypothetical protein